ncbi:polysaccharide pyruvyl transferase family protein [Morganella morganii subsp. morganii]|uniref:polysaccharide pyruvyl transferase family protein n=1 Tax=Morganella morganii TaxID=582 RepID=UPI001647774A|nr:polysaccharide pyruvyl transferase family protein [Morganella morganii]EKT0593524.1 polysaccharide pyruvyl transferase family protein [Morganella morganii]MBC4003696.1 polysaccharide pyruvyl transferase family protein [Morganella morganii]MBT0513231.1 polysaccharide pyruvyl transferase family protein [Morganella morganii subsp. morganii]
MNTKKIGIINFQYSDHNYGAVLQAAALEHIIKSLGFDVEHINYVPYDKNKISYKIKSGFIGYLIKLLIRKNKTLKYVRNNNVFELFRTKWITRTNKIYLNNTDLDKISSQYSAIIVGSDQVWRPKMYSRPDEFYAYFLGFASDATLKISYAASFGVDHWEINDKNYTDKVKRSISRFSSISTRENSGVDICKDIFSVDAQHVLDPTLLVDKEFFDKIIQASPTISDNNIVYYKLDITEKFNTIMLNIEDILKYKTENIYYKQNLIFNHYIPVPIWINKIKNSELVITDSFHCVCFCIIFNKDFFCIRNKNRGESRLFSLLSLLGLEDRFVFEHELIDSVKNSNKIDYTKVINKLDEHKIKSKNFIIRSLSTIL